VFAFSGLHSNIFQALACVRYWKELSFVDCSGVSNLNITDTFGKVFLALADLLGWIEELP